MTDQSHNPFQAPQVESAPRIAPAPPTKLRPKRHPLFTFSKWTLICCISAAPSFVIALSTTAQRNVFGGVMGMSAAIILFIVAYSIVETQPAVRRLMQDPRKRLAARITYGIRMAISIIFPIGVAIDMFIGLISLTLVSPFFQSQSGFGEVGDGTFLMHFVTTMVDGLLMNILVFFVMAPIFGLCVLLYRMPPEMSQVPDYPRIGPAKPQSVDREPSAGTSSESN